MDDVKEIDATDHHSETCTHTPRRHGHTCNHTHTHTHTRVFSSKQGSGSGNREAVRKYREKKKAHTAFLEEEVKKLRVLNRHLVKKLEDQVALESEVSKLRALLVDITGKVDDELASSFAFEKHWSGGDNNAGNAIDDGHAIGAVESLGSATKNQGRK